MSRNIACTLESDKPFEVVSAAIEENSVANQFRVLAVHDVQSTLAEKGFERGPLKIIEVCNGGFAHRALQKEPEVALFLPCKFAVYTDNEKTIVKLSRPSMIAELMPEASLEDLAGEVEKILMKVMEASV